MAVDDRGRLYCGDQGKQGIFRITLGDGAPLVEKVPAKITGAQGMLWAHNSLYVCLHGGSPGSGLYRLLDSDGDDPRVRSQLSTIRRQSISYRRYLVPQRDALLGLGMVQSPIFSKHDLAELRVAAEQVNRVLDSLEEVRDRAAVTQEEIRARREARMSRTLYVLTIVATIALPLGLITGLLGINVGGIPLAGSQWGFALTCGLLVALAVGEVLLFRFMRWL